MIQTSLDLLENKKCVRGDTTTLYWRLGTPVIRRRRNRNVSGKKWKRTPKRLLAVNKFTSGKRLIAAFQYVMGALSSWQRAARLYGANGQTGENLFFSRNYGYCAADGSGVEDFRHFKLSEGQLLLPPGIRLSREGNRCTLEWEVQEEQALALSGDLVHVGIIYDSEPDGLSLADVHGACRADGKVSFTIDEKYGTRVHLYPFFGREDNTDFSDSDYFESEGTTTSFPENKEYLPAPAAGEIDKTVLDDRAFPRDRTPSIPFAVRSFFERLMMEFGEVILSSVSRYEVLRV